MNQNSMLFLAKSEILRQQLDTNKNIINSLSDENIDEIDKELKSIQLLLEQTKIHKKLIEFQKTLDLINGIYNENNRNFDIIDEHNCEVYKRNINKAFENARVLRNEILIITND